MDFLCESFFPISKRLGKIHEFRFVRHYCYYESSEEVKPETTQEPSNEL